jgi:hypothetical protein
MKRTGTGAAVAAGVVLFGTVVSASAIVTYTSDFEEPTFDPFGDVAGMDGWVIDSGVEGISFLQPYVGSQAGAIGGSIDTPGGPGTQVNLTHAVSIPLTSFVFDVDFSVIGSSLSFPGVDNFGWSFLTDSAPLTPLLRIAFEKPGGVGDLQINWYDNTGALTNTTDDIQYNSELHLNVAFSPNGADADFIISLTGGNTTTYVGTLVGAGSEVVETLGADFDVQVGGDGDNFMVFDNLAATEAIPEPSATLLLLPGLFVLLRRRRS